MVHTPLQPPQASLGQFAHVEDWRRRRYLALVHRNGELWVANYYERDGEELVLYLRVDAVRLVAQALGSDLGALSAAAFAGSMDVMEAIGSWSDAETITLASKFKESTGANMTAWTKEQVAKGGKFITGLAASDLSALPAEAVAGLKPTAMMGMDAVKAAAFSADQFKKMSASARDQVSFDKLDKLSADQRKVREAREEGES